MPAPFVDKLNGDVRNLKLISDLLMYIQADNQECSKKKKQNFFNQLKLPSFKCDNFL